MWGVIEGKQMNMVMRILAILTVLGLSPASAAADHTWEGIDRIVAFGDIHGDYEQFEHLLTSAGLIDGRGKWSGGKTHFVQLGDVTDRGPGSRKIVDLIMRLERQARRAKGQVHFVIGNHEAMNMVGDLRYVHAGEYEAFRTPSSERRLDDYYERTVESIKAATPEEEWPVFDDARRANWDKDHPPGYVELRRAWAPGGKYGKWLLRHHAVIRINDMVFMHGGIGPTYAGHSRDDLNAQVTADLMTGIYNGDALIMDEEGPLWYRGLIMNKEADEAPHVDTLLGTHDVSHIIVGHTPMVGAIFPRFGDKVVLIDVGIGSYYGSRQAFLEVTQGGMTAWHRGTPLALPSEGGQARIDYLKAAAALDPEPSPIQSTITRLEAELAAPSSDTSE